MRTECTHQIAWIGRTGVVACGTCGAVEWWTDGRPLDPAEGMASAFGSFEFVDSLRALHAPAGEVLVYRAPTRRLRQRLNYFPVNRWLLVSPGLWMSHDGEMLLLCPDNPVLAGNLRPATGQGAVTR